jgi:ABC-type amino acid transport substrate-binding protein
VRLVRALAALLAVLFVVGVIVWLFERKRNAEQFGGSPVKGIGAGFWWSAVTMTTVGYGDKAPLTPGGRIVGLIWMFVSIVTISGFTAAIASALTVSQLDTAVSGPDDLPNVRVGSISNTTSGNYLKRNHIVFHSYESPAAGLEGLANDEIDAMVYDAPILRYLANRHHRGVLTVLPQTFERQDYGIGLPTKSPYREEINRVLLEELNKAWWNDAQFQYFGR